MFLTKLTLEKARRLEISIEPILWTYHINKDGYHAVKLQVTFNRTPKRYPIQANGKNLFVSKEQWNLLLQGKVKGELRSIKDAIEEMRFKAQSVNERILSGGFPFTFDRFEKALFAKEVSKDYLQIFEDYLVKLFEEERFGTYRNYKCALNALKAFLGTRSSLSPYDITVEFLQQFERFLKTQRKANATTVGIYTRNLRSIYNVCACNDINLKELYPFGSDRKGKYRIKDSRKGSKQGGSLTSAEVNTLVNSTFDPYSPMHEAKMYWLFSFYCQGMNFRDICFLKYGNIRHGMIQYTRQKTKRTEEQEIIEIPLNDSIKNIIKSMGNPDMNPVNYIFSIIPPNLTDGYAIEKIILQKIHVTNKWLGRACKELGISVITTYWSRHTYASLLKYSGVPVEMIRELLGHSDLKTTEHYLKRFDLEAKRAINDRLISLVNV